MGELLQMLNQPAPTGALLGLIVLGGFLKLSLDHRGMYQDNKEAHGEIRESIAAMDEKLDSNVRDCAVLEGWAKGSAKKP